jgi:hypothetical protein
MARLIRQAKRPLGTAAGRPAGGAQHLVAGLWNAASAITVRSNFATAAGSGNSVTLAAPSGMTSGDLMVAMIVTQSGVTVSSDPLGLDAEDPEDRPQQRRGCHRPLQARIDLG